MQLPKTFSKCLNDLMSAHHLSVSALGAQTGSKAELRRALAEESTNARRAALYQRLCECGAFSSEELAALKKSLHVSRIGLNRFTTHMAIEYFLGKEPSPIRQPLTLSGGGAFDDRLQSIQGADKVRILCTNCCCMAVYSALAKLFEDCDRDIQMRHYVQLNLPGCDAASLINCVSPLLFDRRYMPYGIAGGASEIGAQYISGNFLLIRAEKGGRHTELFFVVKDRAFAYELPWATRAGLFSFFAGLLEDVSPEPVPLKETKAQDATYASFMMLLLSRELNRATYLLGGDFCYVQMPPYIAARAFIEKGLLPPEAAERMVEQILPLHEQRYHNFYNKKKHNYCIMSLDSCRRFLQTGRSSDHFMGFRSFTPGERIQMFYEMLQNARANPHYHPLLLKDPAFEGKFLIVCYDKLGVALTAANTDYNLDGGFDYIVLTFPDFTQQYTDYYLEHLVTEDCLPEAESLNRLEELFREYRSEFERTGQIQSDC